MKHYLNVDDELGNSIEHSMWTIEIGIIKMMCDGSPIILVAWLDVDIIADDCKSVVSLIHIPFSGHAESDWVSEWMSTMKYLVGRDISWSKTERKQ